MIITENGQITHTVNSFSNGEYIILQNTTDGIFLNLDYTISYVISDRPGKSATLKFKGIDVVEGFGIVMRLIHHRIGSFDQFAARELASAVTNIWASLTIDKSAAMRAKLVDQYGEYIVNSVWDMMRGNRKKRAHLKSFIAGYMFILKMVDKDVTKFDPEFRVLRVNDISVPEEVCSNWESHPVTKRLGIRSIEEFRGICRNGVIQPEWKAAA
jgi:hypothetical protein